MIAPLILQEHLHIIEKWLKKCKIKVNESTSIYQPTNAHIISHRALLKHFKTLRHVSILSDHHQGALFLAKVMLLYSQFNWYLQTRCCGNISCCVGMCCGATHSHTIRFTVNESKSSHITFAPRKGHCFAVDFNQTII